MFGFESPLRRVSFKNLGHTSRTLSGADLRQILTDFLNERWTCKLLEGVWEHARPGNFLDSVLGSLSHSDRILERLGITLTSNRKHANLYHVTKFPFVCHLLFSISTHKLVVSYNCNFSYIKFYQKMIS